MIEKTSSVGVQHMCGFYFEFHWNEFSRLSLKNSESIVMSRFYNSMLFNFNRPFFFHALTLILTMYMQHLCYGIKIYYKYSLFIYVNTIELLIKLSYLSLCCTKSAGCIYPPCDYTSHIFKKKILPNKIIVSLEIIKHVYS